MTKYMLTNLLLEGTAARTHLNPNRTLAISKAIVQSLNMSILCVYVKHISASKLPNMA